MWRIKTGKQTEKKLKNRSNLYWEFIQEEYKTGVSQDMSKVVVDENSYFVLGDNRSPGESLDSRNESVGTIAKADIKGRYLFKLYPF